MPNLACYQRSRRMKSPGPDGSETRFPPSNWRRWVIPAIRWSAVGLILAGLGWTAWTASRDLAAQPLTWSQLEWPWLLAAGLAYALTLALVARLWIDCLRGMGATVRSRRAAGAFFASQLAKYVPGKAMVLVVRCGLLSGRSTDAVRIGPVIASSFVETLVWVLVGAQIGCLGLIFLPEFPGLLRWGAVAIIVLFGIATWPPIFSNALRQISRIKSGQNLEENSFRLDWPTYRRAWTWSILGWLTNGLALWFVMRAIPVEGPTGSFGLALTTISLATAGGFISMLPGGLGVRELVMIPLLGTVYPASTAVVIAVLIRLIGLAVEALLAGWGWWNNRRRDEW